ncbi:hypothetical protein NA78x_004016 [Anatilimnocola sp. NA78]|uniref:hypothetical protein n=1 Tax=Anatilimnocola sp. NA78 TaxID=3415683 RepID=UPI003CE4BDEA
MTVKEQLEALIDVESYKSCWRKTTPPSFADFMQFASTAFVNNMPADATNLKLTFSSQTEGRINTIGSFQLDGEEYDVFGQIVWVSKHEFFRGKPGFRKKQEPVVAPADDSSTFDLVSDTTKDLNGFGTMLHVSPRSLVRAFGQPGIADEFKVSGMYIFEGNKGSAFRINDYEETTMYWGEDRQGEFPTPEAHWDSEEPCEFRVAGNMDPATFVEWVKARIEKAG